MRFVQKPPAAERRHQAGRGGGAVGAGAGAGAGLGAGQLGRGVVRAVLRQRLPEHQTPAQEPAAHRQETGAGRAAARRGAAGPRPGDQAAGLQELLAATGHAGAVPLL